jgi:hypothetical protein
MMSISEFLRLLEITLWPAVAMSAIFVVRPHLRDILSGAKIRFSVAGQIIEVTLRELKRVLEEQQGDPLTAEHVNYLASLKNEGARHYVSGINESEMRKFLRPLRNAGLIRTIPRNAFLQEASGVELSGLGRLYLDARAEGAKGGT